MVTVKGPMSSPVEAPPPGTTVGGSHTNTARLRRTAPGGSHRLGNTRRLLVYTPAVSLSGALSGIRLVVVAIAVHDPY